MGPLLQLGIGLCAWEFAWWQKRWMDRQDVYRQAKAHSLIARKPLMVVGAPDGGVTGSPGADSDLIVDIRRSKYPQAIRCDVTRKIPLPDDSVVAYVSCTLEYVNNLQGAMRELRRVAPNRIYCVRVQPWTMTAHLYPGARNVLDMTQFANGGQNG